MCKKRRWSGINESFVSIRCYRTTMARTLRTQRRPKWLIRALYSPVKVSKSRIKIWTKYSTTRTSPMTRYLSDLIWFFLLFLVDPILLLQFDHFENWVSWIVSKPLQLHWAPIDLVSFCLMINWLYLLNNWWNLRIK